MWQKLHLAEYGASYELNLSGLVLLRDDGAAENEGLAAVSVRVDFKSGAQCRLRLAVADICAVGGGVLFYFGAAQAVKGKTPLFLILFIAIVPPVAATLLFFYHPPIEKTNHGELMSPVAMPTAQWQNHDGGNFSDEELRGKWVLWQAAAGAWIRIAGGGFVGCGNCV